MNDVRLAKFWKAIQTRLDTQMVLNILQGGRTFRVTENFAGFRGTEGTVWGLQVLKPIATLWPVEQISDEFQPVMFQVASYMNAPPGFDVSEPLEKLQEIVYQQLHQWTPPANFVERVLVSFMITRQRPPQQMPDWDQDRSLWMLSSDYRTEAAPK